MMFRGKHIHSLSKNKKFDGTWVYGYLSDENYITNDDGDILVNPETTCMNTDLKDKKHKAIYEGDIVNFLGLKGKIVYRFGCFGISFKDNINYNEIEKKSLLKLGTKSTCLGCYCLDFISLWEICWNFGFTINNNSISVPTVEIIGNMIDNLELLEEGGR